MVSREKVSAWPLDTPQSRTDFLDDNISMVDPQSKGLQTISGTLAVEIEESVLSHGSA